MNDQPWVDSLTGPMEYVPTRTAQLSPSPEHVADVLIRRTSLAFRGLASGEMFEEILAVFAEAKGWDEAQTSAEREHALSVFADRHRIDLSDGSLT